MPTKLYPMVQFKDNTWEIDEFDCMSIFLLIGTERALLIDTGYGVGDLAGAVRRITDKPVTLVITHGHADHVGGAWNFDEVWIHPADKASMAEPFSIERRRSSAKNIAMRQHGCLPSVYSMFNLYGYDPEKDIVEMDTSRAPVIRDLYDGIQFDLGGGRVVTGYECPGHSKGQMMFLDEQTRTLFVGDALNYNLGFARSGVPVETCLRSLKKMEALADKYDDIYNSHHDFRALGMPLEEDCLPNAIAICEQVLTGNYNLVTVPNFMGMGREPARMVVRGRNYVGINPELIWDKDMEE